MFKMRAPPPPYSEGICPQPVASYDAKTQLNRYLIEIMAFTFDADFDRLNEALGQTPSQNSCSILSETERVNLLDLANLLCKLSVDFPSHSPSTWITPDKDIVTLYKAIMQPAERNLGVYQRQWILPVISSYAIHQCKPEKRALSYLEQKKSFMHDFWRRWTFLGSLNTAMVILGEELCTHAYIIRKVAPSDCVREVLGSAMEAYQEGVLGMQRTSETRRWFGKPQWETERKWLHLCSHFWDLEDLKILV